MDKLRKHLSGMTAGRYTVGLYGSSTLVPAGTRSVATTGGCHSNAEDAAALWRENEANARGIAALANLREELLAVVEAADLLRNDRVPNEAWAALGEALTTLRAAVDREVGDE